MESGYFHVFPFSPLMPPMMGNTKKTADKRIIGNALSVKKEPLNSPKGELNEPIRAPKRFPARVIPTIIM